MIMYRISFNVCRTPYFDETTKSHSEISCVAKFCSSFDTFSVNEKLEIKGLFNLCLRTHSKYPSTNHYPYSNTSHNFFNQKICKYMVSFFCSNRVQQLTQKIRKISPETSLQSSRKQNICSRKTQMIANPWVVWVI